MIHVPIHCHSEYSQLDGLSTFKEIADRCEELGYTAVGNSDHGTVAGHLEFDKVMRKRGIKPIFACELYHGVKEKASGRERDQAHFLAGALNDEGLKNLWRLVDKSSSNFFYVPRVNFDMLKEYRDGLFATSACIQGLVSQGVQSGDLSALNKYIETFGDNFYIELHTYPTEDQEKINQELVQIAEEKGIPTMIATDAHFASPDQYPIHDAYVAIQTRDNFYAEPEDRKMWHPKALYIQSVEEIKKNLDYLPEDVIVEALRNGEELADRVDAKLPGVRRHLPKFVPKDSPWIDKSKHNTKAGHLFIDLVEEGLINRYGKDAPSEVWERAQKEMGVFLEAGLEHYFLQAWDFCQFCDEKKIRRGPGRGSAGGAIVSFALGITDVDPLHYGLMFERFYNPGREKGFPDIDTDFPKARRREVRDYMLKRWGEKNVRSIGTTIRMKPKSACDKTWDTMGVTFQEKETLKSLISEVPDIDIHGPDTVGWDNRVDPGKTIYVMHSTERVQHDTGKKIIEWIESLSLDRQEVVLRWIDVVRHVCSRVANYGIHASGTVVSDVALDAELPCRWATSDKIPVTMFTMNDIDARQFVKQDYLGLRNLDTIEEWEKQMGKEVEWSQLEREDHPDEMWELLDRGLSLGIFQIEDGYAKRLCKEIQPRSVEDLAAIVAMNRPGPIRAGVPDRFIARRFGLEEVTYDHPLLEPILKDTYGEILYQEQVIAFMTAIGYNLSDADAVRKILGKKKPEDMRDLGRGEGEWEGKGYFQMATSAGISKSDAERIWEKIEGFASYSFNKSHAVEYGVLGFRTLYAKYHGPAEFIIALIKTNPEDAGGYVSEGRRMNIKVLAPDIDRSGADIETKDGDILFGFSNVKGIGKGTAEFLVKIREGADITTPDKLREEIERLQEEWEEGSKKGKSPRQSFRANLTDILFNAGCWDNYIDRDLTLNQRQNFERDLLQVVLTDNSEEVIMANLDKIATTNEYTDVDDDVSKLSLAGVVMGIKETRTKKTREAMGVVTIEYEGDDAEFVVFPKQWKSHKFLWRERTVGIFTLKKTERGLHFDGGVKLNE